MSYALNNTPTGDSYPGVGAGASLRCPHTQRLIITIANNAAYTQTGQGDPPVFTQPETFRLPGVYALERICDAIQLRSAAAGTPALVSVEAVPAGGISG